MKKTIKKTGVLAILLLLVIACSTNAETTEAKEEPKTGAAEKKAVDKTQLQPNGSVYLYVTDDGLHTGGVTEYFQIDFENEVAWYWTSMDKEPALIGIENLEMYEGGSAGLTLVWGDGTKSKAHLEDLTVLYVDKDGESQAFELQTD